MGIENVRDYIPAVDELILKRKNLLGGVLETIGTAILRAESQGFRQINHYIHVNVIVSDVIAVLSGKGYKVEEKTEKDRNDVLRYLEISWK